MNKLFCIATIALLFTTAFGTLVASPVTPNCKTATAGANQGDPETCTACKDGYGVIASPAATGSTNNCAKCNDPNCAQCASDYNTCTACNNAFGFKSSKCTACADTNCQLCPSDNTVCTTCKDGFTYTNDDGTTAKSCMACANGCKTCTKVGDSCSACATGITLNKTNTSMAFCCPNANCTACSSTTFCTGCASGVNLDSTKGTCFGFKTGASLTLGAIVSVALFSLLF